MEESMVDFLGNVQANSRLPAQLGSAEISMFNLLRNTGGSVGMAAVRASPGGRPQTNARCGLQYKWPPHF
jgi:hypothetical protein